MRGEFVSDSDTGLGSLVQTMVTPLQHTPLMLQALVSLLPSQHFTMGHMAVSKIC